METVFSVSCANALTLNTKLYWTERCTAEESVHCLDLSTLQESVIVESSDVDAYFGVAVYEDVVYWTGNARVYSASVTGGGSITELLYISSYGGAQFRGITVVHPDLQPDSVNIISPHISSSSSPLVTMTPSISPSLTSSLLLPTPSPLLHTHMYVSSDDGTLVIIIIYDPFSQDTFPVVLHMVHCICHGCGWIRLLSTGGQWQCRPTGHRLSLEVN